MIIFLFLTNTFISTNHRKEIKTFSMKVATNHTVRQKHLNLVIRAFNAVTCHNQPADARAFSCPRVVIADHVGLLASNCREI